MIIWLRPKMGYIMVYRYTPKWLYFSHVSNPMDLGKTTSFRQFFHIHVGIILASHDVVSLSESLSQNLMVAILINFRDEISHLDMMHPHRGPRGTDLG